MPKQAESRSITPSLPRALPEAARKKVSTAIESHLAAVEALTAFLDEADGDTDLEPQCEDEGAACEDEAAQCEDEGADEHYQRNTSGIGAL